MGLGEYLRVDAWYNINKRTTESERGAEPTVLPDVV